MCKSTILSLKLEICLIWSKLIDLMKKKSGEHLHKKKSIGLNELESLCFLLKEVPGGFEPP